MPVPHGLECLWGVLGVVRQAEASNARRRRDVELPWNAAASDTVVSEYAQQRLEELCSARSMNTSTALMRGSQTWVSQRMKRFVLF